jgi:acetyltransferase
VGQKAASSHTGSLTGSDTVCDAFFKQKGIIRVDDIENMIDIAALMQRIPCLPKGKRIGIITTSGGGGILVADEAVALNLDIVELDEDTKDTIMSVIPPYGSALNPVDITAQVINQADDFKKVLEVMVGHKEIDALVVVITQITGESGRRMAEDIVKVAKEMDTPITIAWTTGDKLVGDHIKILIQGGVQVYKSPVRAVRAMGALMNYAAFRKAHLSKISNADTLATANELQGPVESLLKGAGKNLTEHQGKELLAQYGIPVTREEVATSVDHAIQISENIPFPLALKIDSPDILHKTEAGGLKLNITTREDLITAFNEVMANAKKYNKKARINGVLIQEMVVGGTEVIIGVKNDPQFGPTIMFGLGGIFVEILKDVAIRVAPITKEDALEMIQQIKSYNILAGARGRKRADIDAIADVLVRVSRMANQLEGYISELDINPLLVLPEGEGVRVADALVIQKGP